MGAADYPIVDDQTLPSIIEGEVARAIGHWDGSLSESRAREFEYYYGRPFGNEIDGESQVVSTDVADTIEGLLPIILKIFTASDDVVRFEPNGPEDEEVCKQQTEAANYVFYRQNNGFLVLYEWFKDAMIQKNGIVKYWWEEKKSDAEEQYHGLTDGEYAMLMDKSKNDYLELEELEHTNQDDPQALAQREQVVKQVTMQGMQQAQAQGVPPEVAQQALQGIVAKIMAEPVPQIHDVKVKIVKDISQICIEAIPPEEFGISAQHNSVSIQGTPFCYHRTRKSLSYLREIGVPEEIIANLAPASPEPDQTPEALARDRYLDDTWRQAEDQNMPQVWVTECFIRLDYDGDGIAELRHIIMPGRTVWVNEKCDHINFAALTPVIMPHRWIGRSVSELVMDIQFTKSVLWRQMLNNLYLTNNPRKAVLSSAGGIVQANLDDLLTSRPGGIMREYVPNAIRNEEVPFVASAAFPMLEYMDAIKENRTGATRYNQGTDADSLNKTARGIQLIQSAGQERTNLIARIFAETGVKDLMRGIVYMLSKYSSKSMVLKLRNKWVDVDPREWKTQFNMTVNVGLGTGNQDSKVAHLMALHAQQVELMKAGRAYMVSDENLFNLYTKMSEAMGFKHPELFVTDPQGIPPDAKKPPPDPAMVKAQMDAQEGAAKLQQADKKITVDATVIENVEKIKAQTALHIAAMDNATKKEIEQMKISGNAQIAVFEKQHSLREETMQLESKAKDIKMAEKDLQLADTALKVKTDLDGMADEHRMKVSQDIAQQNEARIVEREQAIVASMNAQVSAALGMVGQQIGQLAPLLQQIAALNQQTVAELQKPKIAGIDGIVTDERGRIVSAKVSSKPVSIN